MGKQDSPAELLFSLCHIQITASSETIKQFTVMYNYLEHGELRNMFKTCHLAHFSLS